MRIQSSEVIQANQPFLTQFTPSGVPAAAAAAMAGSMVQLVPADGTEQSVYQVTFNLPFLVLVADPEPFSRTLSNILTTILGAAGSISAMINQIGHIEHDLEEIAKHLKTKKDTGTMSLQIPIHTKNACKYSVSAIFDGKVVIDDDSTEDNATLNSFVQWDGTPVQPPAQPVTIKGEVSEDIPTQCFPSISDQQGTGLDDATVYFSASVSTDGGIVNTEFSSVYVKKVVVTIREVCPGMAAPKAGGGGDKPPKGEGGKGKRRKLARPRAL